MYTHTESKVTQRQKSSIHQTHLTSQPCQHNMLQRREFVQSKQFTFRTCATDEKQIGMKASVSSHILEFFLIQWSISSLPSWDVYKVNVQQGTVTALKHHDIIGFWTMVPWRTNLKCIRLYYISKQSFDIYCTMVLETIL